MKKLYVDFDNTIVNTNKAICSLYDEDFKWYKKYEKVDWTSINTWNFEELKCASTEYINYYFNQPRFFNRLEFMDNAFEALLALYEKYDITIVSMGYSPNLKGKEKWCKKHIPFLKREFINLKKFSDKSHIDMSDGILIDDASKNLKTSNANVRICFGDLKNWNNDWNGLRRNNWCVLFKELYEIK